MIWQHTELPVSLVTRLRPGQDSARDGVAKAGLVGTVVFRRLSTGMCALGWALTQCFGDTPAGSPQRAVSGHTSSVLSVVTWSGFVFTQMIWKLPCCWVSISRSFHLKTIILLQYSFFRVWRRLVGWELMNLSVDSKYVDKCRTFWLWLFTFQLNT